MRNIEMWSAGNAEHDDEFELPLDELAEALEMSAGELLNAIESEEAVCREITNDDGQLMVELEVFGKSCRFKMVSQE